MNSVSQPTEPEENKEYVKSLEGNDKRMFEIFQEIELSRDQAKLIELVESGKIKPNDTNKEG